MATIPKTLQPHINTAFPDFVCLVATALPNGYAQVSPRGSTMAYDDDHIALWERGKGSTNEAMKDGSKVTVYFRKPPLRADGTLPKRRCTNPGRRTTRCGVGWFSRRKTVTRTRRVSRC